MIGAEGCDSEKMINGLGKEYKTMSIAFKPYSCCRWFHSSLDASLEIVKENNIDLSSIQKIRIKTIGGKSDKLLSYMKNPYPSNIVAAEFTLPYAVAVALNGFKPGPEWFTVDTMRNKNILDLAAKVECTFGMKSEADRNNYHKWPSTVDIFTSKGTFTKYVDYPKGSPLNMLSKEELEEKFMRLTQTVLGEDKANDLRTLVSRLDNVSDVKELTLLLIPP